MTKIAIFNEYLVLSWKRHMIWPVITEDVVFLFYELDLLTESRHVSEPNFVESKHLLAATSDVDCNYQMDFRSMYVWLLTL